MATNLTEHNRDLDYIKGSKPEPEMYVKWTRKKLYLIIDTQQIEGKSTDGSSPHYWVYIGSNPLQLELENIMLDIPNRLECAIKHTLPVTTLPVTFKNNGNLVLVSVALHFMAMFGHKVGVHHV